MNRGTADLGVQGMAVSIALLALKKLLGVKQAKVSREQAKAHVT